ncbi:MAG: adenosylcobinamide-phosphate synthase CbiB [Leptolyngbyaceae bacterium]|nr:adenosylcobinamide-phosphate synthase CbiB [Leptolyngbyaceae bacterium]
MTIANMGEWGESGIAAFILIAAATLDFLIGDPWSWPHPVQVMGWGIHHYSTLALKYIPSPLGLRLAGVGLAIALIGLSGITGWGAIALMTHLHPLLGLGMHIVLLAACFAGRSLRDAATDVLAPLTLAHPTDQPITANHLAEARTRLSRYVGRDTQALDPPEILRAILETVGENGVDGIMGPLFYALVGAMTPLGSAPVALAYKAASTLDSMVGYKEPPYTDLGWCSAKLEDLLTWVPCRLTVLTLALLSGRPLHVLRLCRRDAAADPSPNSGWSECAYAASLGVQVGGTNTYKGVVKHKPLMGEGDRPITASVIYQGLRLNRACFLIWLGLGVTIRFIA